jgi:hypothetical protein
LKRYLAIAALLAAAAACARDGSPVAAVPPRLATGVDSQLSLILGGPNKVLTAPKLVTYKITPSGGTAPYSYH